MTIDINDIAGPDGESFKFDTIGATVKGVIIHAETMDRQNQFNGKTERVVRIALEQDDGETAVIWPVTSTDIHDNGYASRMAKAIAQAVRASGGTDLANGGMLAVKYERDGSAEAGKHAPKIYGAQYKPPAPAAAPAPVADSGDASASDLFG